MTSARLKYTCPFTLNDVRIATRKLLGAKLLQPSVEIELRVAVSGYEHRLRSLAVAGSLGLGQQRLALRRVETSPAARLVSFVLANGKGKYITQMSWAAIKADAGRVNPRKPSGEVVFATERLKRSGGTRWTCSFGPRARAAQRMVEHAIFVVAGPSRYEHARKGRGRETATRETLDGIDKKGVRWFGLMDVKDFFPSVTREMVKEVLWFLPFSIISSTIFIHEDTVIRTHSLYGDKEHHNSAFAIRKGIPQGSLASILVAGKVLERHLEKLAARLIITLVDNVMIGGKTEEEVQSQVTALATSFEGHPSGSLRLTGEIKRLGDHTMNYLGYRFRREWPNPESRIGRATFSEHSRQRLHTRIASKLLFRPWQSWGQIIDVECARWVRSFPCWLTRLRNEDIAVLEIEINLIPLIDAARKALECSPLKWSSFQDFASFVQFADGLSAMIGRSVPRLRTHGGPAYFEIVNADAGPWAHFEALVRQNEKHIAEAID